MTNLLNETLEVMGEHDKAPADVRWVGDDTHSTSWDAFADIAGRTEYDNDFGIEVIDPALKVVGDDWWLERHEYDGSEWWEHKTMPPRPPEARLVSVDLKDSSHPWSATQWGEG